MHILSNVYGVVLNIFLLFPHNWLFMSRVHARGHAFTEKNTNDGNNISSRGFIPEYIYDCTLFFTARDIPCILRDALG